MSVAACFSCFIICILMVELFTLSESQVPKNNCNVHCIKVIENLVKILHWKSIVILFSEDTLLSELVTSLEISHNDTRITLMDIGNMKKTKLKKTLDVCYRISPDGYVLLYSSSIIDFLTVLNSFDVESNKTTDFRLESQWIVVNDNPENTAIVKFEWQLRHVLILQWKQNFRELLTIVETQNIVKLACSDYSKDCSVRDIFPNLNYKLDRRHLKIGTIYSYNTIHMIEKGMEINSFNRELVKLTSIIAQILNFTYTIVQPEDKEFGREVNGSWTGLVGDLISQKVDMVIAELTVTDDRFKVIDFIFPAFHIQKMGILLKKSGHMETKWIKLFRPLQSAVYICLIEISIFLGILFYVIDSRICQSASRIRVVRILSSITNMVGFLSMNANGLRSRNDASRILIAFLWMFSIVISASYVGNLTATLTETVETMPFNSLEKLAPLSDWKWGIGKGGYVHEQLASATSAPYKQIWEGIIKFNETDPTVLDVDYNRHIAKVLNSNVNENYAFILVDPNYALLSSNHCLFGVVESVLSTLSAAITVPKNSYLQKHVKKTMMALSDNGFLQRFVDNVYKDQQPNMCKIPAERRPMQLNDLYGLILVFLVGVLSAVLVLLCECYFKNRSTI
ncbi:hypothetical protein LOTGIDRAFT_171277 [Lottia gigantea]|uniref:Ionotropic glutamate receptor L-glutamate and glycine-binding domain-containing protein n=1 Tax=Lottia gigantea TaxID=225164 RepID=V4B7P1_LOTGI|nr:hypothetical protein LOTGIDRAFT_171277 [Lottia gigantea]ESP03626.1 hypothetical protein LOTGIDRAFT_171277 [Lottia gigantea]